MIGINVIITIRKFKIIQGNTFIRSTLSLSTLSYLNALTEVKSYARQNITGVGSCRKTKNRDAHNVTSCVPDVIRLLPPIIT